MCIYDDRNSVIRAKKVPFLMGNFGIWGILGAGGKNLSLKVDGHSGRALRCRQFSGLVATPVLLQMALHSAVRLSLIAEQTLFGHEHKLDHNESRLLVQDRSQLV